jgi:hypothetical protein
VEYSYIILDLGIRWRWVVSLKPRPLHPRHPLHGRLGRSQSRSGRMEKRKILPLPGIEPRSSSPRKLIGINIFWTGFNSGFYSYVLEHYGWTTKKGVGYCEAIHRRVRHWEMKYQGFWYWEIVYQGIIYQETKWQGFCTEPSHIGARRNVVGWGTMLQAGRSRVPFPWGHWVFQLT